MDVRFFMPTKLIIGENSVRSGASELKQLGKKCLIVTGKSSAKACGALDDALAALAEAGIEYTLFDRVTQNPYLSTCIEAADIAVKFGADFILGIGGGSPLDASKAIAVLAANPGIGGEGLYAGGWKARALPVALIGTTSGTGSEVTQYSIITDDLSTGLKKGIGAPQCFATLAFGDPKYTLSLPEHFTISTALDALAHSIEGYFNTNATTVTDFFAIPSIKDVVETLTEIRGKNPTDITLEQRERLYLASIYAGIVISHNRTSYCHSLGYFLTEKHDVSHGIACAAFLPQYIARSAKHRPDRAELLASKIGMSCDKLSEIITSFTNIPKITMTEEEITELARRFEGSANYKAAYGAFGADEAIQVLSELFGA